MEKESWKLSPDIECLSGIPEAVGGTILSTT